MTHAPKKKKSDSVKTAAVRKPEKPPAEPWLKRRVRGPLVPVAAALLLGAFALQAVTSMRLKSVTSDEVVDLPSGYAVLTKMDHRITPEHGVLPRVWAALPLLFMNINDGSGTDEWRNSDDWTYGFRFMHEWGNDCDRMLFWSRFMMVLMALGLGLVIFFWARQLYGNAAGLFALALFAFCPNFLAHGRLVTTDVPIAFTMLLSLFLFDRALRRPGPLRTVLAGVSFGAALLTKFSAPILVLLFLMMIIVRSLGSRPLEGRFVGRFTVRSRSYRFAALMLVLLAVLLVSYATLWAGYGFHFSAFSSPEGRFSWDAGGLPAYYAAQGPYVFCMQNRLLPEAFLHGFHLISKVERKGSTAYLDGRSERPGWRHYFMMTFLYKTPVPMIIFMLATAVLAVLVRGSGRWAGEVPLYAVFAVYCLFAIFSNVNIGHRYILPVMPPLFILVSKLVNHVQMRSRAGTALSAAALGALLLWYAGGTIAAHPHYIPYFNEIAGGPDNGYKHLVDSNLDWGQDLKLLKAYIDENGIKGIHLSYWGNASPRYYNIEYKYLPCGIRDAEIAKKYFSDSPAAVEPIEKGDLVAISVNNWTDALYDPFFSGVMEHKRLMPALEERPVAKIGHSIWVFRAMRRVTFEWKERLGYGSIQCFPIIHPD